MTRISSRQNILLLLILCIACAFGLGFVLIYRQAAVEGRLEGKADRILVHKEAHTLTLIRDGQVLETYHVSLGRGGLGQKTQAGDNKVPEGLYRIVSRNPHSSFHLALRVGYPTAEQLRSAQQRGIDPGGDIMIHGNTERIWLAWSASRKSRLDQRVHRRDR